MAQNSNTKNALLNRVKLISATNSSSLTLGLHADLQMRLHTLIATATPADILLTAEEIALWKTNINIEGEVARQVMASEATTRLAAKDKERDRLVTALFEEIRQAARSPLPERAEAGRRLKVIVDTYSGLQRETFAEETAHIDGWLNDISTAQATADIQALGLDGIVSMLADVNREFKQIRAERAQVKAADMLPTGMAIRAENDELTNAIFRHIEAAHLTAATDEKRQPIAQLIDNLNRVIRETKITHNESMAQKKKKGAVTPPPPTGGEAASPDPNPEGQGGQISGPQL